MEQCIVCGVEATQHFANNKNIPLCDLPSCEVAFIEEVNEELRVEASKKETE